MLSFDWTEFCNDITLNAVLLQIFYKYKGTRRYLCLFLILNQ